MQPFTFDQAIITGLLFLLGVFIGMFFLAGRNKWKRQYLAEAARREELERENTRLGGEVREYESLRHAASKAPVTHRTDEVQPVAATPIAPEPYRQVSPREDGPPDLVIRRP